MSEPCIQDGTYCCKYPDSCSICINESLFIPSKTKKKNIGLRQYKKSERMGAGFEEKIKEITNQKLYAASNLTPNSGAGDIKGDIAIEGCISMALELKTKIKPKITKGSLSFTIQKEWLDKLNKESKDANKEFWALIFSFHEDDNNVYSIIDFNQFMSMVSTMTHDRIKYNTVLAENNILKDKISLSETKLVALEKEIEIIKRSNNNKDKSKLEILSEKLDEERTVQENE